MISQEQYTVELDRNFLGHKAKKFICPSCNQKRYVRYYSHEENDYMPYEYGRCDREHSCGYFVQPNKESYTERHDAFKSYKKPKFKVKPPTSYFEHSMLIKSMKHYEHNTFVQFLIHTFGEKWAAQAVKKYYIGTSKHWRGANIFWQVDSMNKIRSGKIMLYKPDGRRNKFAQWVHTVLEINNFNLLQCLFGEHLLINSDPKATIAIVESEKTAIIASYFFPEFIWVASGGKHTLDADKCKPLIGRKVVFFPDLGDEERELWSQVSSDVNSNYGIRSVVSDFMNDVNDGSDIADKLLEMPIDKKFGNILNKHGYPASWDV